MSRHITQNASKFDDHRDISLEREQSGNAASCMDHSQVHVNCTVRPNQDLFRRLNLLDIDRRFALSKGDLPEPQTDRPSRTWMAKEDAIAAHKDQTRRKEAGEEESTKRRIHFEPATDFGGASADYYDSAKWIVRQENIVEEDNSRRNLQIQSNVPQRKYMDDRDRRADYSQYVGKTKGYQECKLPAEDRFRETRGYQECKLPAEDRFRETRGYQEYKFPAEDNLRESMVPQRVLLDPSDYRNHVYVNDRPQVHGQRRSGYFVFVPESDDDYWTEHSRERNVNYRAYNPSEWDQREKKGGQHTWQENRDKQLCWSRNWKSKSEAV